MKLLTLEQVKQNFLERFISENEGEDEGVDELKEQLDGITTLEELVPLFDDLRFESHDVHSIIQFTLECCVSQE